MTLGVRVLAVDHGLEGDICPVHLVQFLGLLQLRTHCKIVLTHLIVSSVLGLNFHREGASENRLG